MRGRYALVSYRPAAPNSAGIFLTWTVPTDDENSQPLSNLAGYLLYAGQNPGEVLVSFDLANPAATSYLWNDAAFVSGQTWYVMIRAYTSTGAYSVLSDPVSKVVP